jgi:restriction endonuclease S subunit
MTGAAGQQRVPTDFLKEFILPFPNLHEQSDIVSAIKKREASLEAAVSTIDNELKLIEEFRDALITEAVTGKLDVTG